MGLPYFIKSNYILISFIKNYLKIIPLLYIFLQKKLNGLLFFYLHIYKNFVFIIK